MTNPTRPLIEIPGYRDVYCQLCDHGPRSSLVKHISMQHDIDCQEYKRRFGRYSIISIDFRLNAEAILRDRVEEGLDLRPRRRKGGLCRNGHRMTVKNSYLTAVTYGVNKTRVVKRCRTCDRLASKRRHATPPRPCGWCGKTFGPRSKNMIFCCKQCGQAYWNKKANDKKRKDYSLRPCATCGQPFKPNFSSHRYCSDRCRSRASNIRQWRRQRG